MAKRECAGKLSSGHCTAGIMSLLALLLLALLVPIRCVASLATKDVGVASGRLVFALLQYQCLGV